MNQIQKISAINIDGEVVEADDHAHPLPPMLFEMMRSFVMLAQTLNLSATVERLGVTRQTVRRHIRELEALLGCRLIENDGTRYVLTEKGHLHVENALRLLGDVDDWAYGRADKASELLQVCYQSDEDNYYCSLQHKLDAVWDLGTKTIQWGLQVWFDTHGKLDHPLFEQLRPYAIVYRPREEGWLCTHMGEESALAHWFGPVWARSQAGLYFEDYPLPPDVCRFIASANSETVAHGTARYDHIATVYVRERGGPLLPLTYQRLLMSFRFADGSPALVNVSVLTDHVSQALANNVDIKPMIPDVIRIDD